MPVHLQEFSFINKFDQIFGPTLSVFLYTLLCAILNSSVDLLPLNFGNEERWCFLSMHGLQKFISFATSKSRPFYILMQILCLKMTKTSITNPLFCIITRKFLCYMYWFLFFIMICFNFGSCRNYFSFFIWNSTTWLSEYKCLSIFRSFESTQEIVRFHMTSIFAVSTLIFPHSLQSLLFMSNHHQGLFLLLHITVKFTFFFSI